MARRSARGHGQMVPLVRILNEPAQRARERARIVRGYQDPSSRRDGIRGNAGAGSNHRQAMGDGLGISHAVAFEAGGEHEQIGPGI